MEVRVGARVHSRDGDAGAVRHVVLGQGARTVNELVVDTSKLLAFDVVVPWNLVVSTTRDKIELDCTIAELRRCPEYVPAQYVRPEGTEAPAGVAWDDVRLPAAGQPIRGAEHSSLQGDEVPIRAGMLVRCADGPCGSIDEVDVDPVTNRATSFVVRRGRLFPRDVVVPTSLVRDITPDGIHLTIRKEDLARLGPDVTDRESGRPAA